MVRRRVTWLQVAVLLALVGAAWAFLATFATRHGYFDLKVYYGAINFWAHGDGEVYDYLKPLSKYGFTYPPFAALCMLPMAVLSWPLTIAASVVATLVTSLVVIDWLVAPVVARFGWTRWFVVAVAMVLATVSEPLRETFAFGQVNMQLVFLVVADLILLGERRPGSRWAGVGVGLATAIKLTPGIFVLYLLLARRYRAAATATGTAVLATLVAAAIMPTGSRIFWTDAVWDTDRVGSLSFISNQSLEGFVARLHPADPSTPLWAGLVLAVLAVWAWRVRRAVRLGDDRGGLALTGILGCLVSPVTWTHHLVWLLPALLLLTVRGLLATGRRRIGLLSFAAALYVLLSSKLVWVFYDHFTGWGLLCANAYLWGSIALLVALPLEASSGRAGVADLGQLDDGAVRAPDRVAGAGPVGDEPGPLVEPSRGLVRLQHP